MKSYLGIGTRKRNLEMLNITKRTATNDEIINSSRYQHSRVRFRHFIKEIADCRTETGVRHQRYSSAKPVVIDGIPHVKHQGEMQALRATHVTMNDNGSTFISDLRLDSEYLD